MPLTTRCRHCGRLFPVYAQQLKERRGKVECPQCGGRVNALIGLLDEAIPGSGIQEEGQASGGRRTPAATAPASLLTFDEPRRRPSRLASGLWLFGILVLITGLTAQAAWWERGSWLHQPRLRAATDRVCAHLGCKLTLPRIAGTMEILQPGMGEHPQDPRVLRLNLTLLNRALITQRHPLLQLEFYDDEGELVAARRLTPDEYRAEAKQDGLAAGAAMNLVLDLAMPETPPAGFRVRLF